MVAAMQMNREYVTLDDAEINKRAVGRVCFWALGGDVTVDALSKALAAAGCDAEPPKPVTAKVALHRAVETVAKLVKGEAHHKRQAAKDETGKAVSITEWCITSRVKVGQDADGAALIYPLRTRAWVDGPNLIVEGGHEVEIRTAFAGALAALAPSDVGSWLCEKIADLGGVPLRESGGFYFLPADVVEKWETLVEALHACSAHKVLGLPAMRSADAVEAVLTAITADTRAAVDAIVAEIPTAGKRALATREQTTAELLTKVERYEGIVGQRLTDLRAAIEDARAAVVAASLAAGSEDA